MRSSNITALKFKKSITVFPSTLCLIECPLHVYHAEAMEPTQVGKTMSLAILMIFFGNTYVNVNHSENQLNHVKTTNIIKGTL